MTRTDGLLLVLVVASALGLVAAQHEARKLVTAYEGERARMQQLEVEWGQLQLEQGTWASHGRIEKIAKDHLHMAVPDPAGVLLVEGGR